MEESCPEPPLIQFLFKETMEMHLDERGDEWRRCCKSWMLVNCNLDKYFSAGRTDVMMERRRACVRLSACENSRAGTKLEAQTWRESTVTETKHKVGAGLLCSVGTFWTRVYSIQFQIIRPKRLKEEKVGVFSRFSARSHQLMLLSTCCWCSLADVEGIF